jgi:predicted transcriptional regulator
MQKVQPQDEVTVSARVERRLRDDLQQVADRNERSFSAELRRALRLHVLAETRIAER